MGLPDNRDIEPIRDDLIEDYNNQPAFVIHHNEENQQMEVDDESDENNGYSRLQTFDNNEDQPADDSDSSESDEEEENENASDIPINFDQEPVTEVPQTISAEGEIEAEVWNAPRPQDTIDLSTEKTQQILKAMSNFTLPNVPQWANDVNPSELIQRIRNKESPVASSKTH